MEGGVAPVWGSSGTSRSRLSLTSPVVSAPDPIQLFSPIGGDLEERAIPVEVTRRRILYLLA